MESLFTRNKNGVYHGIHRPSLHKIVRDAGYRNLSEGGMLKDSILCKETSNKIEMANLDDLWNYVLSFAGTSYLKQDIVMKLRETMGDRIVKNLDRITYVPYKDDRNTCRLFLKNGALEINRKDGSLNLIDWSSFSPTSGKVLSTNVSDISIDMDTNLDYKDGSFYKFCRNVVGGEGLKPLMIALGYLIHSYKDESKPYLIVFSEGGEKDNNKSSGGTGKSLILKNLIQCVRTQSWIDGEGFKGDSSFKLQSVNRYSDNVLIDDLPQKFKYRSIYTCVTDTMVIEKKGLTPTQVPYKLSPKIAVTTNFGLIANSPSDLRRRRVIGVKNYYSEKLTPFDEFGHNFFSEWTGDRAIEWQYCYQFIIECVRAFFANNCVVENYNHRNIETRALANAQNPDLMEYCIDNYSDYLGSNNLKGHNDWAETVIGLVGRSKGSEWKSFRASMEAIGLKSSSGVQIKENNVNVRKYYFTVEDYDKLHDVLVNAGIEHDHKGTLLVNDGTLEIEPVPEEFIENEPEENENNNEESVPDF